MITVDMYVGVDKGTGLWKDSGTPVHGVGLLALNEDTL